MKTPVYIPQAQYRQLSRLVAPGKVLILYGPRRVGKTTLLRQYAARQTDRSILMVSGDDIAVREYLESQSVEKLKRFTGPRDILIVDEAQYIRQVGLNLKLLVDHVPDLSIIASGSSSFDLARQTGEPLTGRKRTLLLLPLAQLELQAVEAVHETGARLEHRLVYGSYPEVVLARSNEECELYLKELVSSYLFKDILALEDVRHADKLRRLLQLLAFQVGKEVSVKELGTQLGMNKNTVERYLDLLEKVFVIYARFGFSRNLRKEITKSRRYYFIDNGIRNAIINNFNPLSLRDDTGALWENYICVERMKANLYRGRSVQSYFWRTYDRQEIDLIEDAGGHLLAVEIKWGTCGRRCPPAWARAYSDAAFEVVHRENYLDFIT
ncbi:MAG: ATP-binding protein [Kiritimatiellaeota bacterium]|nr:ATP-binding protein [Kiritimatiellota bacterium]